MVGGHTFAVRYKAREHLAPCRGCHTKIKRFNTAAQRDYDGDGRIAGVQDEVTGLLRELKGHLDALIQRRRYRDCSGKVGKSFATNDRLQIVIVDERGNDLGDCDRNGAVERLERPFLITESRAGPGGSVLYKLSYNYLLVQADASRGLHNLPYAVSLLQQTIQRLSEATPLPTAPR